MLRRWWTNKYKLPWTPNNVGDFTVLDLLTEFYEDVFERDKSALFEASRGEDGEIVFESTGDPLIDKWEKELAMGVEPDLTEGMTANERSALISERAAAERARKQLKEVSSIDDRFDQGLRDNPRYASKFVAPGSTEEQELLGHGGKPGLSPLDLLSKGK